MKLVTEQKLVREQQEPKEKKKIYYICKDKFKNKYLKDRKYRNVRDQYHYTRVYAVAAHSICNLKYIVLKKFL